MRYDIFPTRVSSNVLLVNGEKESLITITKCNCVVHEMNNFYPVYRSLTIIEIENV